MPEPVVVHADDNVEIRFAASDDAGSDKVLLSFTGIGHALGGIDFLRPEFRNASAGYAGIYFVSDMKRTWGNNLDFDLIRGVIEKASPGAKFDSLGNSMGGFLALLAPSILPIGVAMAFAPQFSVNRDIAPFENRWLNYRDAISHWKYPSLDGVWQDSTKYYAFIGSQGIDGQHADMFPDLENIVLTRLPGEHNIAADLKSAGLLHEVIRQCSAGLYDRTALLTKLATPKP